MVDVLRSVELDKWTEKQTTSMRLGGNRRLDEYLKEHDHSSLSSDLQQKYDNTVAEDYRFMLATEVAQALGLPPPEKIVPRERLATQNSALNKYKGVQSISSDQFFGKTDIAPRQGSTTHNGYQRFDDDGEPACCGCC
ncbi:uncharacterized protein ACA1_321940 [Acanthamoeba castellanii str. Neff]|uniref:Arf-GAP domain-containing protein n=1 Tax=Acanthamoeba castellanii (strain ATCC 30010 / Neff) TaxID=1257118 RepID=L8HA98_ACACF|nr:uncharacterized protein ACA1_321940 [Acanthamoeba castellanii str. Neff]ELR22157.1 hypothetical protein ACA1_321940 [Acanthamoeba castellanii str. Neff]